MAMNVAKYISNLGKSVSYAAVDKFSKISPTTADLVQTNSELFKEVTHNILNYRNTYKKSLNAVKTSKIYEAADTGITSVFEDLQSGKLWNKERIDKIETKNLGDFGGDGFTDMDFGDSDNEDFGSFNSSGNDITGGDKMVSGMIAETSHQNAQMVSSTIARSSKYLADTQKTSSNMMFTQNMHAYGLFNNNLSSINSNIAKVLNFQNTTIQTNAENTKKYYETSTKLMEEQTSLLRQLVANSTPAKTEAKKSSKIGYSDVLGSGVPDLKMYMKNIKKNFGNSLGSVTSLNSVMGEDSNMLELFMASPMQFVPTYIVNKMIPKSLDASIANFDKSLKGFFGSIIAKLNGMKSSDNPIMSKIGEIFGISNIAKSSIETKNYNKGKVDWDGKSRKALIEVIPAYLSKIVAALSGKSEKVYDYDEGKFTDSSAIKKSFNKDKKQYSKEASGDVIAKIDEYMKYITYNTIGEQKKLKEDMEKILSGIYDKGGFFDVNSKKDNQHNDYGVDSKSMALFKTMFKNMDRSTQLGLGSNVVEQRDRQTKDMKSKEESADSIIQSLFNGFNAGEFLDKKGKNTGGLGSNNLLKTLDNRGNNIFYYMQNIWKELVNIKNGNSGNVAKPITRRNINDAPVSNTFQIPDNRKVKIETQNRQAEQREQERFIKHREKSIEKDKKIINISDIDDDRALSRKLNSRLETEKIKSQMNDNKNKKKSMIDKLLEAENMTDKTKTVVEKLNEITKKPMKFITNTINKVDKRMYDMVFGTAKYKGKDVNGIFGIIKLELTTQFSKLNNFIDEKILSPIKQKLDVKSMKDISKKIFGMFGIDADDIKKRMHDYLFNKDTGLFTSIKDATKNIFKKAFEVSKDSLKAVYGPAFNKIKEATKSKGTMKMQQSLEDLDSDSPTIQSTQNSTADIVNNAIHGKKQKEYEAIFNNPLKHLDKDKKRQTIEAMLKTLGISDSKKEHSDISQEESSLQQLLETITRPGVNLGDSYSAEYDKRSSSLNNRKNNLKRHNAYSNILQSMNNKNEKDKYQSDLDSDNAESALTDYNDSFKRHTKNFTRYNKQNMAGDNSSSGLLSVIKEKISGIFDLLKSSIGGSKSTPNSTMGRPSALNNSLVTNPEGRATFDFAQDLTNVIANWMYGNMPHHEQGGVIDKPQVATLNEGEVVLTPDKVASLLDILNEIESGSAAGKSAKKIGLGANGKVQKFVESSNIRNKDDFTEFMDYSTEDPKMLEKLQKLQATQMYDKIFNVFNINLEKALEEYNAKISQFDKDGAPTDPIQRAMYNESEPFAKKVVDELYSGTTKVRDALFGTNKNADKKKFGEAISDVTKNISKYAPEAIGAGLLGGGVSLITGAIGGPLLGAAVGAGISLTKNSEKMQNWLFGDFDQDTHERKGGVFSKKLVGKISKLAPDLQKYGIAGGLTGLLPLVPFGPIGGLMLGSSIAFAKNNEHAMNFLFGENGLIKPKSQKTIKKYLPKMAAGAAIGLLTGPFGLLGNAAIGTVGGMLSSNESFNKVLFGVKDPKTGEYENGILPSVRHVIVDPLKKFMHVTGSRLHDFLDEKILAPLKSAFEPIKKDVKMLVKGMFGKIGDFINNSYEKSFGIPLSKALEDKFLKPLKGIFSKVFKAILFPVKKVVTAPFSLIGAYGKSRRKSHIRNGNADYMSAEERNNFRKTNKVGTLLKKDKLANFDETLVNMSDDDKTNLYESLELANTNKKDLNNKKVKLEHSMGSEISKYISYGQSKKAMENIQLGNSDLAKQYVDEQNSKNLKKTDTRHGIVKDLSGAWKDKTMSPSDRAKLLKDKQKDLYTVFDTYEEAKQAEKLLKAGKFDEVTKMINSMRDKDNTKAFDLINLIDANSGKLKKTNDMIYDSDSVMGDFQKKLKGTKGFENIDLSNKKEVEKYMNLIKKEIGVKKEEDPNETPEQSIVMEMEQDYHKEVIKGFDDVLDFLKVIVDSNRIGNMSDKEIQENEQAKKKSAKNAYRATFGKDNNATGTTRDDKISDTVTDMINKRQEQIESSKMPAVLKEQAMKDLLQFKTKEPTLDTIKGIKGLQTPKQYLKKFRKGYQDRYHMTDENIKAHTKTNYDEDDREKDEEKTVIKEGVDPSSIASHAKGGLVNKTRVSTLSKGEYVNAPNNVDSVMKAVPTLLTNMNKNETDNRSLFQQMLDRLTSLVKFNKDDKNVVEKIDDAGNVMKFYRNGRNDLVADRGDKSTVKAIEEAKDAKENNKGLFSKFGDMFKGFMAKVNPFNKNKGEDGEKKTSFLDTIMSTIKKGALIAAGIVFLPQIIKAVAPIVKDVWDNSVYPWIKNSVVPWFKDTALPFIGNALVSAVKFAFTDIIPALAGLLADAAGKSLGLSGENGEQSLGEHTAEVVARDAVTGGRGVTAVGKFIANRSPKSIKGKVVKAAGKATTTVVAKAGKIVTAPLRGIDKVTGLDKIAPKLGDKAGTFIMNKSDKVLDVMKTAAKGEGTGIIAKLCKKVLQFMEKLTTNKIFIKFCGNKKVAGKMIAKPIIEFLEKNAVKLAAKVTGKVAAAALSAGIINAVWAIADFISGYNDADNIMGVTTESTFGMKIAAGVIKAIDGLLLFGLIPEKILVDIFLPVFANIFDSGKDIQSLRDSATTEVDKYNEENGTDYSVEQYNKTVLGKKGLIEGIWDNTKAVGTRISASVDAISNKAEDMWDNLWGNKKSTTNTAGTAAASASLAGTKIGDPSSAVVATKIADGNSFVQNKAKVFWENATKKVTDSYTGLEKNIPKAEDAASKKLGLMFGMVNDKGEPMSMNEGIGTKWESFSTGIKNNWDSMKTTATETFTGFKDKLKDKFKTLRDKFGLGAVTLDEKLGSLFALQDNKGNAISLTENANTKTTKSKNTTSTSWGTTKTGIDALMGGNGFGDKRKSTTQGGYGPAPKSNPKILKDGGFGGSDKNGMTYYSQGDPDWSSTQYGTGTIGSSGCGPTSAAMVISSITGKEVTPVSASQYSVDNGFRVPNVGTSWGYFKSIGEQYGINFNQTTDQSSIMSALQNNQPVIFSGQGGQPFTTGGHFVVGAGTDGDNININDPVNLERSKAYPSSKIFGSMATAFIADKQLSGSDISYTNGSSSSSDSTNSEKPSVFNMVSDFGTLMSRGFNRIFGFENDSASNETDSTTSGSATNTGASSGLVSNEIVNYLKSKEGFMAQPYYDTGGVRTIGYGSTHGDIMNKASVTEAEATAQLMTDLNIFAASIKSDLDSKGIALKQNEFDVLSEFAYGTGLGSKDSGKGLFGSTLYKRILNGERGTALNEEFAKWVKDNKGNVLEGLKKRRVEEASIFSSGVGPNYSSGGGNGGGFGFGDIIKSKIGGFGKAPNKIEKSRAGGFGKAPNKIEKSRAGGFGKAPNRMEKTGTGGGFGNILKYKEDYKPMPSQSSSSDSSMTTSLIKSIIGVLIKISSNTDNLQKIVELLATALDVKVSKENIKSASTAAGNEKLTSMLSNPGNNDKVDNSALLQILNSLATE